MGPVVLKGSQATEEGLGPSVSSLPPLLSSPPPPPPPLLLPLSLLNKTKIDN